MSSQQELTTTQAASIGALGGLCLVLLKLMQAQFYLDNPQSRVAIVAYMTYCGFLVFSAVAGVYFAEHNAKKNTFIAGLLAPSILLTFFSAPNFKLDTIQTDAPSSITKLSWLPISSAAAQTTNRNSEPPNSPEKVVIKNITQNDLQTSYKEAILNALGRQIDPPKYLFLVGRTTDQKKAVTTAQTLNSRYTLQISQKFSTPEARVFQFNGSNEYFVSLGGIVTSIEATQVKKAAFDVAIEELTSAKLESKTSASLLAEGVIIDARDLLK